MKLPLQFPVCPPNASKDCNCTGPKIIDHSCDPEPRPALCPTPRLKNIRSLVPPRQTRLPCLYEPHNRLEAEPSSRGPQFHHIPCSVSQGIALLQLKFRVFMTDMAEPSPPTNQTCIGRGHSSHRQGLSGLTSTLGRSIPMPIRPVI